MWQKIVRFGFRLLYNEMAWTYDVVSWLVSLGEWRRWQLAALDHVQGEQVLEIAHGTGHLLPRLAQRGYAVAGMDLSAAMGQIASGRLRELEMDVPLLRGSAMALPFEPAQFDTIVTTFPTAFVVEPDTLRNVKRVLAEDGRLVIVMAGALRGRGLLERLIALAYWLTGQTADVDAGRSFYEMMRERYAAVGLDVRLVSAEFPNSTATLFIATHADQSQPQAKS